MPLTDDDRRFLDGPRLGFLTVDPQGSWPTPVPVWFAPGEQSVELFTVATARKARAVAAVSHASLVAANHIGEAEHWVAVIGPARIETAGARELAARLADRYWDLSDPALAAVAEEWQSTDLVRIVIEADVVRRYGG
jgi:hypothetical protein